MKRVLLIRPVFPGADTACPTGLLCISSYLLSRNIDVIVRDLAFQTIDDLWSRIRDGSIAIIGISMLSYARKQSYELVRRIKQVNPSVKVVIGGIHATSVPDILLDVLPIDAVVIGEGEETLAELYDLWVNETGDLKDINGIYTREYGKHKSREFLNSESIPLPNYNATCLDWFHSGMVKNRPSVVVNGVKFSEQKFANVSSSRGCLGKCTFCNAFIHWRGTVRIRPPEQIFSEIDMLYNQYSRNLFYFNDDAFGQSRDDTIKLCRKIVEKSMKIAWFADTRVDVLDDEMMYWMGRSGCFCLSLGIESGSQKILDNINKGIKVEHIVNAVKLCKRNNIKAYALLMIGNIGETDETIDETIKLMTALDFDLYSALDCVLCFPGTKNERLMIESGAMSRSYWASDEDGAPGFYYGFSSEDVRRWNKKIRNIPLKW